MGSSHSSNNNTNSITQFNNQSNNYTSTINSLNTKLAGLNNQLSILKKDVIVADGSVTQENKNSNFWNSQYKNALGQNNGLVSQYKIGNKQIADLTIQSKNIDGTIDTANSNDISAETAVTMVLPTAVDAKYKYNELNLELYDSILKQNTMLIKQNTNNTDWTTTNNQLSVYKTNQINYYSGINTYLFYFYYALFFISLYVIFALNKTMNFYLKIFIIIVMVIYPFIIYNMEIIIYYFLKYIYSLMTASIYTAK